MAVFVHGCSIVSKLKVPISDLTEGTIVKINENGTPVDFYVTKHDYERGLNGTGRTLLVRKDCYDKREWHSRNSTQYAYSSIDVWLNNSYKAMLDADIQTAIGTTTFYYSDPEDEDSEYTDVTSLSRSVFLLSLTELGKTSTNANAHGSTLPIASTLQIAYMNGSAVEQWTRTCDRLSNYLVYTLSNGGGVGTRTSTSTLIASRPCFTLPYYTLCVDNGDGTYSVKGVK